MSRTNRSFLSSITFVCGSLVSLVIAILTTPLLLGWLGEERFGAFRVSVEWIGYIVLLDFGLSGTLQAKTAERLGKHNHAAAICGIRQAMRRFVFIAILQWIAILFIGLYATVLVKGISQDHLLELRWGLAIACVGLFLAPLHLLRPLLDSSQQSYWVNLAIFAQSIGIVLLSVLFASVGWGLIGQFLAVTLGSLIFTTVLLCVVRRRYSEFWTAQSDIEPLPLVEWPMLIFNVSGRIGVLSDSMILGAITGSVQVTIFYVTQRFFMTALAQVYGIGNSAWAALAELYYRKEMHSLRERFHELNRLVVLLCMASMGPLWIVNEALITLWVGKVHYGGEALSGLTAIQASLMAIVSLWAWPFAGTGKMNHVLTPMVIGSLLNIVISIVCTIYFGIVGPALGTVVGYLLVFVPAYAYLLRSEFGVSVKKLLTDILIAFSLFLPFGLVMKFLVPLLNIENWSQMRMIQFAVHLTIAILFGLVYLFAAYRLILSHEDRVLWKERFLIPLRKLGLIVS